MIDINKMINEMVRIACDSKYGYSQINRLGPNFDCSSFVCYGLRFGGAEIPNNLTTYNMLPYLKALGYKEVAIDSPRKMGDIFLNVNHHVVMCIDESRVVNASISENGTIDGKTGDQLQKVPTGQIDNVGEIRVQNYYKYSKGWDYHLTLEQTETKKYKPRDILDIAFDTYSGLYGNGETRKNKLGDLYNDVQAIVNIIWKYR